MTYYFGKVQPFAIYLSEEVSIGELVHALRGTLLHVSNRPTGALVIHRMIGTTTSNGTGRTDPPPSPEAA